MNKVSLQLYCFEDLTVHVLGIIPSHSKHKFSHNYEAAKLWVIFVKNDIVIDPFSCLLRSYM